MDLVFEKYAFVGDSPVFKDPSSSTVSAGSTLTDCKLANRVKTRCIDTEPLHCSSPKTSSRMSLSSGSYFSSN